VQEDDGFPFSVATFGIVERHVRREVRRGELHSVGLVHCFPLPDAYSHEGSILSLK
jgi:hypothetical protein